MVVEVTIGGGCTIVVVRSVVVVWLTGVGDEPQPASIVVPPSSTRPSARLRGDLVVVIVLLLRVQAAGPVGGG